jgi:transposase
MTNAYPMEFRRDVVQVARHREPGVTLEKIAADFGIHPITLSTWLKRADIENGVKPGTTSTQSAELREANKRIRLLEQEAEVLKRALAYVSQGALPGKSSPRS